MSSVIAVPVSGTAPGLLQCLRSISRQRCVSDFGVLLLLQNSSPATVRLVRALVGMVPYRLRIVEIDVFGDDAHLGWARRLAMDAAAQWLEDCGCLDGTILTMDADAVLPSDWLALNFAALSGGADCVVGGIDYADANGRRLPANQQRRLRLEAEYDVLLSRIRGHFDPAAHESAGRHALASTGSLAVPLAVYRSAGRIAPVAQGAERALADSVEATGGRVRYAAGVRVVMPARSDTRPITFEPVAAAVQRAQWRSRLRQMFPASGAAVTPVWAPNGIPAPLAAAAAQAPNFAAAWRVLESGSPILHQDAPGATALPGEIAAARKVVAALTAKEVLTRTEVAPFSDSVKLRVSQLIAASAMRLRSTQSVNA